MSKKQTKKQTTTTRRQKEPLPTHKELRTDTAYWSQPLWYRIYCRVLYAILAFIVVSSFFSVWSNWNIVMQCVFGGLVALAVLLWRVAFPNGMNNIWEGIMEGMSQGLEEQAKQNLKNKKN